ncbi:MAG: hypothetical protein AAGH15_23450 [Myxococcota bacterium]
MRVVLALALALSACGDDEGEGSVTDAGAGTADTGAGGGDPSEPCQLSNEVMEGVLMTPITDTFAEGNWGIASTCTYATAADPTAVLLSSAMSTDLSADRMFPGAEDVAGLGDDAVWVPTPGTLTVVDAAAGRLVRVTMNLTDEASERALAEQIATLALPLL